MTTYLQAGGEPIYEFILPDECIKESNEAIDQWMALDVKGPEVTNVKARQTEWNLQMPKTVEFTCLCCKMISNLVYGTGGRVFGGLNDGTNDIEYYTRDVWGADYSHGDYTLPHCHFPADFSAVGFLKLDEGCSPVIFDLAQYYPAERQLIIFDGKLKHSVPPTPAHRRVFAMNLYKEPGTF